MEPEYQQKRRLAGLILRGLEIGGAVEDGSCYLSILDGTACALGFAAIGICGSFSAANDLACTKLITISAWPWRDALAVLCDVSIELAARVDNWHQAGMPAAAIADRLEREAFDQEAALFQPKESSVPLETSEQPRLARVPKSMSVPIGASAQPTMLRAPEEASTVAEVQP
jgi:hypothetical protein